MSEGQKTNIQSQDWRWLFTFVFALLVFWTGLLRSIEVQTFKPNAFYFCLVTGLMSVVAGFLYWLRKNKLAMVIGGVSAAFVLGYYLFTFITAADKDANIRVGTIIIASIAELIVIALPTREDH